MDLAGAINRDKQALLRILAGLFALLGQNGSILPQRIERAVHSMIGLVLRPAESAVRRLIVLVSLGISTKPAAIRPMPQTLREAFAAGGAGGTRLTFKLFDPRPRLLRRAKTSAPKVRAMPRITFFGGGEVRTISLGRTPRERDVDGLIAASALLRRLAALKAALDNLPRQARRLARAVQRRQSSPRLKGQGPLRRGRPPGYRRRWRHEVDEILRRCHDLAREVVPDTS